MSHTTHLPEDAPTEVDHVAPAPALPRAPSPELHRLDTWVEDEPTPLPPTLGPYRLLGKIADGGIGVIYEAEHAHLGRRAAIKQIREELARDGEVAGRFLVDAVAVAHLDHPGIVRVYDYQQPEDAPPYLVMERLEGESLRERLRRGPLPLEDLLALGRAIAETLAVAHEAGMTHRDLRPERIYLTGDPSDRQPIKILGFGMAGSLAQDPAYVSPEQSLEMPEIDHRADVYALGCLLFEMACGRPPYCGEPDAVADAHRYAAPPSPRLFAPAVPPALEELLCRMLAKRPADRPASMTDVAAELATVTFAPPPRFPLPEAEPRFALPPAKPHGLWRPTGLFFLFAGLGLAIGCTVGALI